MQFELTEALIDSILFAMEDQDGEYLLDTHEGIVTSPEVEDFFVNDEERYIPIPHWGPSDGFNLMERFTAGLRSPPAREELTAALDRGRGVFRAFKDALSRHPEAEKRWFGYKEREMRREVIRWYNGLRETWGLELIGGEPEDIADLALEDFRFREGREADREAAAELHRLCREALRGGEDGADTRAAVLEGMGPWAFPGDLAVVAETAGGEFAAYISAVRDGPALLHIAALEVHPEYRGLGLGGALLTRLLEQADGLRIPRVSIDLPAGTDHFSRALLRESFKPCVVRYRRGPLKKQ